MFPLKAITACVCCHQPYFSDTLICPDCRDLLAKNCAVGGEIVTVYRADWQQIRVLGYYDDLLARLISLAKFNNQPEIIIHLARLFAEHLKNFVLPGSGVILPVPMPTLRRLFRGYNQADLIGYELARQLQLSYQPNLVRCTGHTKQQHLLNRTQRMINKKTSYRCAEDVPERIYLIDDVMTTGATAQAICQRLRAEGARYIEVWVLGLTKK